jgi:tRNA/tmRNA/rRNA uracil-C5-methylase (TrmA/RlmC/RlmD family)
LHVRGSRFGFFREGTHDLCDARATRQLLPASVDALERVMAAVGSRGAGTVREIELSENADASQRVVHLETSEPLDPRLIDKLVSVEGLTPGPYVTDTIVIGVASFTLRRHVLAFFQGNRYLLSDLVKHVSDRVPRGAALLDLYAGVGLFAVAAAVQRGAVAVAVEGDHTAFDDLSANAEAAGARLTAIRASVEGLGASLVKLKPAWPTRTAAAKATGAPPAEVVIVDPPRTGMSAEALVTVVGLNASRLIYVSCDVATLARDARRIVDAGYAIERVDAFDMFPNTPHVETVVVFSQP